ncbi:MAG: excinuclease ABC subunit A [Candidatus Doudnabacteria bacterium RIFCSPHIGHO2_02_FULL_46_11]|uniref:UvrABC system protein A n=1 Tax=Candidatus Doudnabacteria bacterium RIFCSPHIGHO2_02_FULL_46_11 TaxID=1817832 RepID=A0A1F5P8G2_9BACT|nr:MAG: excinuclease ABC subunit A [Candidatus Doudnabacteria bacterium RIFCSPHIGHO2_02_FULL_46_11]
MAQSSEKYIKIRGARQHNLKNVDLDIPRNKLVVMTGLSGSGKSSLAFDTIYAEGQRRYVESLSAYARQFLGLMDKPDVDKIEGLSPAISIDQKSASHNPRSTVGTVTEIYDYLRLLFARVGIPHCPVCGKKISGTTITQMVDQILSWPIGNRIMILAPLVSDQKGEQKLIFEQIRKAGYARVRLDGQILELDEAAGVKLDKNKKHKLDVIVDRLRVDMADRIRVADSLESALDLGSDIAIVIDDDAKEEVLFSQKFSCPSGHMSLGELNPRNFSFNSPHGACPTCTGLGTRLEVDPDLLIPNPKLSLSEGAIRPWTKNAARIGWYNKVLSALALKYGFSLSQPVKNIDKKHLQVILYGSGENTITVDGRYQTNFEGVVPNLERRYRETDSNYIRQEIEGYMRVQPCPTCNGARLKKEVLGVTVAGKNIVEVASMTIDKALEFFNSIEQDFSHKEKHISQQILKEIRARLQFLINVGLSYLSLDREASTLSGGEAQRIRLATQIGSGLTGVLYILDEPSIGLHQRDNNRLLKTLKELRDLDNTVIVVEHDEDTMRNADYIVDVGPGAGKHGGEIVSSGTPAEIIKDNRSLTGAYLSGREAIPVPGVRRAGNGRTLTVVGAEEHNLKKIDARIPLGKFVVLSGVSGSGKSTLLTDILSKALSQHFYNAKDIPGKHGKILGLENIDKIINIDQSPIGRTPRSNPATYTGLFTYIRELFAATPEAKIRGYKAGRFSFNVRGGRCEVCAGEGMIKIEMHFLADVYVNCEECKGKRYNKEALDIHYKGKTIADVLEMTVDEAKIFFRNVPAVYKKLDTLSEVGLGYMHLGQPATTLSGGEAQRIKLATELSRSATGRTLYILDEPTTGLHFADVRRLLSVLSRLVDKGNTVVVIEHNLDVLKSADWIIDLGPEGGIAGGKIVAEGTPEEVAKVPKSYTGQFLKRVLTGKRVEADRKKVKIKPIIVV